MKALFFKNSRFFVIKLVSVYFVSDNKPKKTTKNDNLNKYPNTIGRGRKLICKTITNSLGKVRWRSVERVVCWFSPISRSSLCPLHSDFGYWPLRIPRLTQLQPRSVFPDHDLKTSAHEQIEIKRSKTQKNATIQKNFNEFFSFCFP